MVVRKNERYQNDRQNALYNHLRVRVAGWSYKLDETTPNGDWMEVKEDGTHIQYSKEQRVKISKFKNGSELQENDDGSTIETDSEGMVIEKMGNIYIEIRTDGSRLQKDGETGISIEKFGDGTTVQVRVQFVNHTIQ